MVWFCPVLVYQYLGLILISPDTGTLVYLKVHFFLQKFYKIHKMSTIHSVAILVKDNHVTVYSKPLIKQLKYCNTPRLYN